MSEMDPAVRTSEKANWTKFWFLPAMITGGFLFLWTEKTAIPSLSSTQPASIETRISKQLSGDLRESLRRLSTVSGLDDLVRLHYQPQDVFNEARDLRRAIAKKVLCQQLGNLKTPQLALLDTEIHRFSNQNVLALCKTTLNKKLSLHWKTEEEQLKVHVGQTLVDKAGKPLKTDGRVATVVKKVAAGSRIPQDILMDEKEIAIVLSGGPDRIYTPKILKTLKRYGAKATFLPTGLFASRTPLDNKTGEKILRDARKQGHWIGASGYSGKRLPSMRQANSEREILRSRLAVKSVVYAKYFAPVQGLPYGASELGLEEFVREKGFNLLTASIPSEEWRTHSLSKLFDKLTQDIRANAGGVLILREEYRATSLVLPALMQWLDANDYHVVDFAKGGSQLIGKGT